MHSPVSDCMTPKLITVDIYTTLAEALEIMQTERIRRLPVAKEGKLIGIITLKDIYEAKPSDVKHSLTIDKVYLHLTKIIVQVAMTSKPITVYQNDTVGHAAEVMLDEKIGGLPVIDANEQLVGIITDSDIFRLIANEWREENLANSGVSSQ